MASNLACIGLDVWRRSEFRDLVASARAEAETIAKDGEVGVHIWTDVSGARLIITTEGDLVRVVTPTFYAAPGAIISEPQAVDGGLVLAELVNQHDEVITEIACQLEELALLGNAETPITGPASIVVLGNSVQVIGQADAAVSGLVFEPTGAYAASTDAVAHLTGVVLAIEQRTVSRTGQGFTAARVQTDGFQVTLCLPTGQPELSPGDVVEVDGYVVASLPSLR
ncbi:hypothetical protein ACH47X_16455 [Promicromonospora kroppenstedtii]|uniref:RCK C-terminal domain-containing protein n=1 Tax=Promicromonospora kroppenstedtii TaxID=440482 RepID=A0ABW7XLX7_9MICO|nr:hypothetical protein [Promicromonospora kroppenstedtii]